MNRKFIRGTLLVLIAMAAIYAAAPSLGKLVGITIRDPMTSFVERQVVNGPCEDDGVTLVIDYGSRSKRPIQTFCATHYGVNTSDNGWDLFAAASQKANGTADYPTGFVCRINGFPSRQQQSCSSPASGTFGSWAYFTAARGTGWVYSHVGVANDTAVCGDWKGWRFVYAKDSQTLPPRVLPTAFKCS